MKRRTIDASKLRRPLKRSRITESIYGSVFVYLRFFLVWIMVLTADFLLEFRFEYLWPFWMLLRSAYDSFKYQGLAFSLLFLALAFCSDILCLMFLPIHWLFFAASTYVWVQFVWQTERGLCLPTISLWLLFVYVEASVRLRELKNLPFHLDLCRPFAAHCIGYPMVTLGYGVKSYVGYKIRQRRTQQVGRENEFYMQLIAQALPPELRNNTERSKVLGSKVDGELGIVHRKPVTPVMTNGINTKADVELLIAKEASRRGLKVTDLHSETTINEKGSTSLLKELDALASSPSKRGAEELLDNDKLSLDTHEKSPKITNGRATFLGFGKSACKKKTQSYDKTKDYEEEEDETDSGDSLSPSCSSASGSKKNSRSGSPKMGQDRSLPSDVGPLLSQLKDEKNARRRVEGYVGQLESDLKRLKADLQASRQCELDLRSHMHSLMTSERGAKAELQQLRSESEIVQQRLQSANQIKQQDRNTIASLERKAKQERDGRLLAESQLRDERKRVKAEETAQRQREETLHESCSSKHRDQEEELRQLRGLISEKDELAKKLDKECDHYRKKSKEHDGGQLKKETEILMSALTAMQGKNTHLENSLSSETRLKLDLFTALGDTRRQLEVAQEKLAGKEREMDGLKAKIAEVMAVMPATTYAETNASVSCFSVPFSSSPTNNASSLDPNASVYIPGGKNGLL